MTPRGLIREALGGRRGARPLFAPRACAIAGEIEGLAPGEVLANATKLANLLRELHRGSGLDVVWVASESDVESDGARLAVALEAAGALRGTLGDVAAIGWCLRGPAALGGLRAGDLAGAGTALLDVVRQCCRAADVILLDEAGAPEPSEPGDVDAYAAAVRPIAATARFFQALPVLSAPSWAAGAPLVPCVDAVGVAPGTLHALRVDAAAPAGSPDPASCVLVTTEELTGRMPLGAARQAMAGVRRAAISAGGG